MTQRHNVIHMVARWALRIDSIKLIRVKLCQRLGTEQPLSDQITVALISTGEFGVSLFPFAS